MKGVLDGAFPLRCDFMDRVFCCDGDPWCTRCADGVPDSIDNSQPRQYNQSTVTLGCSCSQETELEEIERCEKIVSILATLSSPSKFAASRLPSSRTGLPQFPLLIVSSRSHSLSILFFGFPSHASSAYGTILLQHVGRKAAVRLLAISATIL